MLLEPKPVTPRKRPFQGIFVLFAAMVAIGLLFGQSLGAYSSAELKAIATFLTKGSKYFTKALPDHEILELAARASKPGGTKEVGKRLGARNLPNAVLEDAFARILVAQHRVERGEAEQWIRHLSEVPGFRSALSKSMGASTAKSTGHLNEIRVADNAAQLNFEVKGIGVTFNDPYKNSPTDIDVLLKMSGRDVAIEAKDYLPNTSIPLDSFRGDMQTLAEYRRANRSANVLPIFWLTHKPADPGTQKLLDAAAKKFEVELLYGTPEQAIYRIPQLLRGMS